MAEEVEGVSIQHRFHLKIFNLTENEYKDFITYIKDDADNKGYVAIRQLIALAKNQKIKELEQSKKLPKTLGKKDEEESK